MKCPYCGEDDNWVTAHHRKREGKDPYKAYRYRRCRRCSETFKTVESVDLIGIALEELGLGSRKARCGE